MKMKTMIALLATLALPGAAHAGARSRSLTIKGAAARNLMEALAAAGLTIKNVDQEWGKAPPFSVDVKRLSCDYNAVFPDEWMADVECTVGSADKTLKNSLALAKAIQPYAQEQPHAGARTLSLEAVSCTMTHVNKNVYSCRLAVPSEDQ